MMRIVASETLLQQRGLKVAGLGALGQAASGTYCICACLQPLVNVVYVNTAGWHELTLWQRSLEGADSCRSYDISWEDLDYIASSFHSGNSFAWGHNAWQHWYSVTVAKLDGLYI